MLYLYYVNNQRGSLIFIILFYVVYSFQKYFHLVYHDYYVPFTIEGLFPDWGRIPSSILYRLTKNILPDLLSVHPQDFICTIEAAIKAFSFIAICTICSMGFFATSKEKFNIFKVENLFVLPLVFFFFSMPLLNLYPNNLFFGRMKESVVYFEYFFCFLLYFTFFIFLLYTNISFRKISIPVKILMILNSFLLGFWIEWFNISTFISIIIFILLIRKFNVRLLNNKNLFLLLFFFFIGMICFYLLSGYSSGTRLVNYSYNWNDLLHNIKSNLPDFTINYIKYMFWDKKDFYAIIFVLVYFLISRRTYNVNLILITSFSILLGYLLMNLLLIIYREAPTSYYSGFLFQADQYEILYITILGFIIILLLGAFYFEYFNYRRKVLAGIIVINIILFSIFLPNYVKIQKENKNTKMLVYSLEKNILVYSILGETAILPISYLQKPAIYNRKIFVFDDQYSYSKYLMNQEKRKISLLMKNKYFDSIQFFQTPYFEETYNKEFKGVIFVDDKIAQEELDKRLKLLNFKKETTKEILENDISFNKLNNYKDYMLKLSDIKKIKINKENENIVLKAEAYLHYMNGEFKPALKLYSLYLKKVPNDIDALQNIADIYLRLKDVKKAEEIYLKLNKIDKNNLNFMYELLKIYYYNKKEYKKALEICNKMIKLQDNMINLYINKAVIYIALKNKKRADGIFKYVADKDINKINEFLEINQMNSIDEIYGKKSIILLEPLF